MVSILQYKFEWPILSITAHTEIEPILSRWIHTDIGISFHLDGEWCEREYVGSGDVSSGEAAVDDDGGGEL